MSKPKYFYIVVVIGALVLGAPFAYAERIKEFTSTVLISSDNSVQVTEHIVYDSEGIERHGILRDIRTLSSENRKMKIEDISVSDDAGTVYQFAKEGSGDTVTLRIGDPSTTFSGVKTYVISYRATDAVAHLQGYDEIYWNATGNSWPFPIDKASVVVNFPQDVTPTQSSCYLGITGSTESCTKDGINSFETSRTLSSGEGLTVAVGFPKGFAAEYRPKTFWQKHGIGIIAFEFPVILLIILFFRWRKYGRDPKGRGVIVPQYDVPEGLTPIEVAMIVHEKMKPQDISAEIIYLATMGYIKIRQIDKKALSIFKWRDYELTLTKDPAHLANDFDRSLVRDIFISNVAGTTMLLSSLQNVFYKKISTLNTEVRASMLEKHYYKHLPKITSVSILAPWAPLIIVIILGLFSLWSDTDTAFKKTVILLASFVACKIIFDIFRSIMPAKTEKGVELYEYIRGLKDYLQIAEKDRLAFHNAPEKKPEVFEKLLPYALVLGVEKSWAKEFKDIYTTPPNWYSGPAGSFNALTFTHDLGGFSSMTASSLSSAPGGGGSGGGGSSGGGGGGGGGGSW